MEACLLHNVDVVAKKKEKRQQMLEHQSFSNTQGPAKLIDKEEQKALIMVKEATLLCALQQVVGEVRGAALVVLS